MFDREKTVKNLFKKNKSKQAKILRTSLKNKCFMVAFMQKIEYAQNIAGRCISYRSKKNGLDSIVIRNKRFGAEVRFLVHNPRFVILI